MRKLLLALLCCASLAASARDAAPAAADPQLEKRVMALSEELRCLVCQNQTIADSHAELAIDLRKQVREQLASGRSESEVVDYMVQRYGAFVLYKPPVNRLTWLLWFGPFALLLGAVALLLQRLGTARRRIAETVLTQAERDRAAQLLAAPNNKELS